MLKPKNEVSSVIEVPLFRPSFYLADNPQKVYNIHRAICLAYSCICSIRFKSEIQLFRLRIAVNAIFFGSLLSKQPRFQSNITSTSLLSNQIHHRIDGISLASFNYGKRQLVMKNLLGNWSQSETTKYFEWTLITKINPLGQKSDQHQFSPNKISRSSRVKVMRITNFITEGRMFWY